MLSLEEMAGIAEVMGVISEEEIIEISLELAFIRDEIAPDLEDIIYLIQVALMRHWLEYLPNDALCGKIQGSKFYVAGPASFGTVPPEMDEIIEIIEFEGFRSFDWETITCRINTNLSHELERLEELANDAADGLISVDEASKQYSELLNLYYDYDLWLPVGLPDIGEGLENISMKLSGLKGKVID